MAGGEDSRPSADPYLSGVCFFYIQPGVPAHENRSPRICRDFFFFFLEWSSSYHPSRLSNKSLSKAQGKHQQQTHTHSRLHLVQVSVGVVTLPAVRSNHTTVS